MIPRFFVSFVEIEQDNTGILRYPSFLTKVRDPSVFISWYSADTKNRKNSQGMFYVQTTTAGSYLEGLIVIAKSQTEILPVLSIYESITPTSCDPQLLLSSSQASKTKKFILFQCLLTLQNHKLLRRHGKY